MARPEPTPAPDALRVAVVVDERSPYEMFDLLQLTGTGARLRGPLLLEVGERLRLRVTRADLSVDVGARVTGVARGEGREDPVTDVGFDEGSDQALRPILGE